jgi:hypothetical protein
MDGVEKSQPVHFNAEKGDRQRYAEALHVMLPISFLRVKKIIYTPQKLPNTSSLIRMAKQI